MVCCSVYGCSNNHRNKELTFFRFPKDEQLNKQWVWACRRKDPLNMKTARICSIHFQESDHYKSLQHELLGYTPRCCRKLKVDAVPTLHLPMRKEQDTGKTEARLKRIAKRDRHKLVNEMLTASLSSQSSKLDGVQETHNKNSITDKQIDVDNLLSHSLELNAGSEESAQVETVESTNDLITKEICVNEEDTDSQIKAIFSIDEGQAQNEEIIVIAYDDSAMDAQSSKDKLIRVLLNENKDLKSELVNLKTHLKQINNDRNNHIRKVLKPIFTEGQIRCLLQDYKKRIQWSPEDIASANALRSVSANAYRYLRNNLNYPLPAVSTLRRCLAKSFNDSVTEEIVKNAEEISIETENVTEESTEMTF